MPVKTLKLTNPEPPAAQSFLFRDDQIREVMVQAEARGEYTAQRLKEQDPAKYAAIIELRGLDWSEKRIAELLKVHHRTVAAVSDAEPQSIDAFRAGLIRKLNRASSRLIDRVVEHPDTVPIHVAGLIASQFIDKAELLAGRATVRIGHEEPVNIYDDWDQFVEKQLQPGVDVIEISSGTGLVAKEKPANAAPALADRNELDQVRADAESEAQVIPAQQGQSDVTSCVTDRPSKGKSRTASEPPGSGRLERGRGGDADHLATPNSSTGNGPQKILGNEADRS